VSRIENGSDKELAEIRRVAESNCGGKLEQVGGRGVSKRM
jgi:hypothetical protein